MSMCHLIGALKYEMGANITIQYIIQYDMFSLYYVRDAVCLMCGISVLCEVFSLCYV